ncbi:universal stress protein [Nostocoides japonicum]|nr:universal stress protein [Tetrasphaera japonica]
MTENTPSTQSARVVAATDGGPDGTRAVRFGAREAVRRGMPLHLVHVVPQDLYPVVEDRSLEIRGNEVLHAAVALAHEEEPDLTVTATLVAGSRVPSILNEIGPRDVVVLSSRGPNELSRIWTGSTTIGVAARAGCPVLVLPSRYDADRPPTGRVTAGLQRPDASEALLEVAFAEASRVGASLLLLHAWRLPSGYDDIITGRTEGDAWAAHMTAKLRDAVAGLRERHPEVPVETRAVHGQPARVLVDAAVGSDRLVIGKPAHGGFVHHLGGTARGVLREATCPVLVVPAHVAEAGTGTDADVSAGASA